MLETRLVHDVHRTATELLGAAAAQPAVSRSAVSDLRDFVVAVLRHHHESEDRDLWPIIRGAAPGLEPALAELTAEHERVEAALTTLEGVTFDDDPPRSVIAASAALDVRDLIREHLDHEEPVLFPALRRHVTIDRWDQFSRRTIDSAPQQWTHLLVALFDRVGSAAAVDVVLGNVPAEARQMLPEARRLGNAMLDSLAPVHAPVTPRDPT